MTDVDFIMIYWILGGTASGFYTVEDPVSFKT